MIIAIDGPTASGKGSIAKRLAAHYGLPHLDTGALYRAVGAALLARGLDPSDERAAAEAALTLDADAIDEAAIRTAAAGAAASIVAAQPEVRKALLDAQRRFADRPGGAVLDGRDIATVVCPHADVKLFVTADLAVRAERRWRELTARGETIALAALTEQIAERDRRDMSRADAPLLIAEGAQALDTTALDLDAAVAAAVAAVERARSATR